MSMKLPVAKAQNFNLHSKNRPKTSKKRVKTLYIDGDSLSEGDVGAISGAKLHKIVFSGLSDGRGYEGLLYNLDELIVGQKGLQELWLDFGYRHNSGFINQRMGSQLEYEQGLFTTHAMNSPSCYNALKSRKELRQVVISNRYVSHKGEINYLIDIIKNNPHLNAFKWHHIDGNIEGRKMHVLFHHAMDVGSVKVLARFDREVWVENYRNKDVWEIEWKDELIFLMFLLQHELKHVKVVKIRLHPCPIDPTCQEVFESTSSALTKLEEVSVVILPGEMEEQGKNLIKNSFVDKFTKKGVKRYFEAK